MRRRVALAFAVGTALAWNSNHASAQVPNWEHLSVMFDYDQRLSLDTKEMSVEKTGSARLYDITYASPMGGPVPAYLVVPTQREDRLAAAVLFLHPGHGNRSTFLPEALTLARSGVISLLIDAPYLRPSPWTRRFLDLQDPIHSRDSMIQTVVDLRRGIDLLVSRQDVDSDRIAFVGHSLGATMGGILAGVENRPKSFILMAGQPVHSTWWRTSEHVAAKQVRESGSKAELDRYIDVVSSVDAIHYVGHAADAAVFFQFATRDVFISKEEALQYFSAASEPKRIEWYDTEHGMNENARRDRFVWLREQLDLR